jgi:hypothetical protein
VGDTSWHHDNKEWQKTLDLAQELGWPAPTKANAHGGLVLQCPSKDHRIRIFSTGKGTESVAIQSRRKIQNCQHRDLSQPLVAIRTALEGASRMLDAAEKLLDVAEAEQSALAALDALESVEIAADQLAQAEAMFDAATQLWEEAEEDARHTISPGLVGDSVDELTGEAHAHLRTAELALRDDLPNRHADWPPLRERHEALAARLAAVRDRTGAL